MWSFKFSAGKHFFFYHKWKYIVRVGFEFAPVEKRSDSFHYNFFFFFFCKLEKEWPKTVNVWREKHKAPENMGRKKIQISRISDERNRQVQSSTLFFSAEFIRLHRPKCSKFNPFRIHFTFSCINITRPEYVEGILQLAKDYTKMASLFCQHRWFEYKSQWHSQPVYVFFLPRGPLKSPLSVISNVENGAFTGTASSQSAGAFPMPRSTAGHGAVLLLFSYQNRMFKTCFRMF